MILRYAHVLSLCYVFTTCLANTETHLVKIPQFYNIPTSHRQLQTHEQIINLNLTHSVVLNHPIETIEDQLSPRNEQALVWNIVCVPYDTIAQPRKTLLFHLGDPNMQNGDLYFIKLCWPATSPYEFRISHEYIKTHELLGPEEGRSAELDLYLRVDYRFFGVALDPQRVLKRDDSLEFLFYIEKMPVNWLPIPLEMYDLIVYLADIAILIFTQFSLIKHILGL
ncbi:uncharacterized protein LODBEIA_P23170 [Lodderomyces beijingensis]|uniref:Phosphatidylinositol-glycan biosynthesis class X protein n=1 Tax=Lodderomyces beijingensis TaxID=1775926 RepID=A0ABP0ZIX8_9ASCO